MAVSPVVVLLLLLPGILTEQNGAVPIDILVVNGIMGSPDQSYSTSGVTGGILLGYMTRLMASNSDFKFTYREDLNYGPFLVSVNGVAGSDEDHTYWELLVKTTSGDIKRLDVGIGCYMPKANEQIILNFQKW